MIRRRIQSPEGSDRQGFTLLEVLVSSAILLGLLVLLLGACEGGARFWNQAERRRAPLREAGAALRLIGHDLRSAVVTSDPASLLLRREKSGEDSVFFLVSHPSDHRPEASPGDLCATGYFIAPSPDRQGELDLYRFHASGHAVLEAVRSGELPDLYATAAPGTSNTELLARHVASLRLRPIGAGSPPWPPAALGVTITTVDARTGSLLREQPPNPAAREEWLALHGARLSAVVSLPPVRDTILPR